MSVAKSIRQIPLATCINSVYPGDSQIPAVKNELRCIWLRFAHVQLHASSSGVRSQRILSGAKSHELSNLGAAGYDFLGERYIQCCKCDDVQQRNNLPAPAQQTAGCTHRNPSERRWHRCSLIAWTDPWCLTTSFELTKMRRCVGSGCHGAGQHARDG
jgi:hypothetical protein